MSKLEELAASGFSSTAIEAAVNTIEFSLRENNTGSFPRGLSLMLRAVGAWIYDQDPFTQMQVGCGEVWVVGCGCVLAWWCAWIYDRGAPCKLEFLLFQGAFPTQLMVP